MTPSNISGFLALENAFFPGLARVLFRPVAPSTGMKIRGSGTFECFQRQCSYMPTCNLHPCTRVCTNVCVRSKCIEAHPPPHQSPTLSLTVAHAKPHHSLLPLSSPLVLHLIALLASTAHILTPASSVCPSQSLVHTSSRAK